MTEIEQQDWMPIPPGLRDGLSSRSLSRRQLHNWSLVLQARQIPCQTERAAHGWSLLVPAARYAEACDELRGYEAVNRNWPPPLPPETAQRENTVATIWVLIALACFHLVTQQQVNVAPLPTIDWYGLGNADAGKILAGQWWRLATALTLHAGGLHLAGNLVVGGLFVNRLCRDLGSGLGWGLVLLTGVFGNLLNAWVQSPDHRSIGASTAVFGAVGLIAALNLLRYRRNLQRRWLLPVAAALGLLALLGAGGEHVDIAAHLFGFGAGIILGLLTGFGLKKYGRLGLTADRVLAGLVLATIVCAWLRALA